MKCPKPVKEGKRRYEVRCVVCSKMLGWLDSRWPEEDVQQELRTYKCLACPTPFRLVNPEKERVGEFRRAMAEGMLNRWEEV